MLLLPLEACESLLLVLFDLVDLLKDGTFFGDVLAHLLLLLGLREVLIDALVERLVDHVRLFGVLVEQEVRDELFEELAFELANDLLRLLVHNLELF